MMKQLDLFSEQTQKEKAVEHHWVLFVDGAARNNPGPAGGGVYLLKDNVLVIKEGFFLGTKTNNQAEYLALLIGLYLISQRIEPNDTVSVISDSELLVRQINGVYKVKHPHLKPLHALCLTMINTFAAQVSHVLRHE